jgi:hypothetical protein
MVAPLNPYATTNAAGQFYTTSDGFVAGMAIGDPVARFSLATGVLGANETLPMWGGVGISESIPLSTTDGSLGGTITRATTISTTGATGALTGFSTSDQMYAWLTTPQSTAPSIGPGGVVGYYRFRCGARIILPCSPGLVNYDGSPVSQAASWDFGAQQLVPFSAAYPQTTITGATWASTSGGQNTYTVGTDLTSFINAGDVIEVSGIVSTGGDGTGYNGQQTVVSINSTTIVTTNARAGSPGTYSSGGIVVAGGGQVPGMVLQTQAAGNKTIAYNATTGAVNYVNTGAVAVFLLN